MVPRWCAGHRGVSPRWTAAFGELARSRTAPGPRSPTSSGNCGDRSARRRRPGGPTVRLVGSNSTNWDAVRLDAGRGHRLRAGGGAPGSKLRARATELQARRSRWRDRADAAEALSVARRGGRRSPAIEEHLHALAMPHAVMEVVVEPNGGGRRRCRRPLAPNPVKPLACPGRVRRRALPAMLAARVVLTEAPPTLVFDEIDAGIGGEAGSRSGACWPRWEAASGPCVTHLAVAAFAHAGRRREGSGAGSGSNRGQNAPWRRRGRRRRPPGGGYADAAASGVTRARRQQRSSSTWRRRRRRAMTQRMRG
jgi:hypothetical protein